MSIRSDLRNLGVSAAAIERLRTVDGKPVVEPGKKAVAGRMNKTETLYSYILDDQVAAGEILRWAYESLKFRLADRTWYTPDFACWLPDGRLRLVEIKGGLVRDDAKVKFRVAREAYPEHEWLCFQRTKAGWRELFPAVKAERKERT